MIEIPVMVTFDQRYLACVGRQHGLRDSAADYLTYFDSITLILTVDDDGSVVGVKCPEFPGD